MTRLVVGCSDDWGWRFLGMISRDPSGFQVQPAGGGGMLTSFGAVSVADFWGIIDRGQDPRDSRVQPGT